MPFDQDLQRGAAAPVQLTKYQVRDVLEAFLASPDRPQHTMNFYQLDGYLHALIAGPETTELKEWMPLVFVDQNPNFSDKKQELMITQALDSFYNSHRIQWLSNLCELPCANEYCEAWPERADIEQWARGFMQGFIVCQPRWNFFLEESQTAQQLPAIIKNTIYDEIDAIMAIISNVADAEYALSRGFTSEELKGMFARLPHQVVSYGKASQLLRKYV